MLTITVDLKIPGLRRLQAILDSQAYPPVIVQAVKEGAKIFRTWLYDRFEMLSAGGADEHGVGWEPLAASTLKGKKSNRGILRDTDTLIDALDPEGGAPGSRETIDGMSFEVGYGGGAIHPGGITINQLAQLHQFGTTKMPARTLVVEPPPHILHEITKVYGRAWRKFAKELINP